MALLVVLLIALAALGVYIVMRLAALRRRPAGDLALFAELAEAHGLHPADRKYLIGLARREGLDDPARLFIEKRHLEAWAKSSTDPTPRALFAQLFGE